MWHESHDRPRLRKSQKRLKTGEKHGIINSKYMLMWE